MMGVYGHGYKSNWIRKIYDIYGSAFHLKVYIQEKIGRRRKFNMFR